MYIGTGCIIIPGVNIGDNVIIGAGSVVTRNIPSGTVYAGIPARFIRSLEEYEEKISESVHPTKKMSWSAKKEYYLDLFR